MNEERLTIGNVELTDLQVEEFLNFLSEDETYLDTGYGAFHTDNHSNW